MNEKSAYQWLRDKVAKPGDRIDRLENLVSVGMPDVNGCFSGTEFWIEVKAPIEPKRETTPLFGSNHKLSQDQKNWILKQKKARGCVYVFIATDNRKILIDGGQAEKINEMTISELEEVAFWKSSARTTQKERNNLRNALVAGF